MRLCRIKTVLTCALLALTTGCLREYFAHGPAGTRVDNDSFSVTAIDYRGSRGGGDSPWVSVETHPSGTDGMITFARTASGLRAVVEELPHSPVVYCAIWVPVGLVHGQPNRAGIAYVTEHCLLRTETVKKGNLRKLERLGAEVGMATSLEYSRLQAWVRPESAMETLRLLRDMLVNPAFNREEFEKAKASILREIKMLETHSFVAAARLVFDKLIPNYPLYQPVLSARDSIAALTFEDICAFYCEAYRPDHKAIVTLVGPVDGEQVLECISSGWEARLSTPCECCPATFPTPSVPPSENRREVRAATFVNQSYLGYGAINDGWKDSFLVEIDLLYSLLGPLPGSYIYRKAVVQESLTDFILGFHDTKVDDLMLLSNCGFYGFIVGGDETKIRRFEWLLAERVKRLRAAPLPEDELEIAKAELRGRVTSIMQSNQARATRFAYGEMYEHRFLPDQYLAELDAITPEQMHAAANHLLEDDRQILVAIDPARGIGVLLAVFRYLFLGKL